MTEYNFTYLDKLIHENKQVKLEHDIILDDNESTKFEEGIKLDEEGLIIDADGYHIDAQNKSRIFTVLSKNIVIKNAILENARNKMAAAIYNSEEATLIIDNSTLTNCESFEKAGCIYNAGQLTINKCYIHHNKATNIPPRLIQRFDTEGGAIFNASSAKLSVNYTVFERNCANNGGAIFNWGGSVTIDNSFFYEDLAKIEETHIPKHIQEYIGGDGDEINSYANGTLNITDTIFVNSNWRFKPVLADKKHNRKMENCEVIQGRNDYKLLENYKIKLLR